MKLGLSPCVDLLTAFRNFHGFQFRIQTHKVSVTRTANLARYDLLIDNIDAFHEISLQSTLFPPKDLQ